MQKRGAWGSCILFAVLLSCGPVALTATESTTGQLWLHYPEDGQPQVLEATVVQQRPGSVFRIANWAAVQDRCRLPECRSGATVTVTGTRGPGAPGMTAVLFTAVDLTLVEAAALKRVQASPTVQTVELTTVARQNLASIVLRPRLPEGCAVNQLEGSGNMTTWSKVIQQVNTLQKTCTAGQLSYKPPVVSGILGIPCTPMSENHTCDPGVYFRWMSDAMVAWKNKTGGNLDAFDHQIIDLPVMQGCSWAAMGLVGGNLLFVNGYVDPVTVAHEMGHGYGLGHSAQIDLQEGGTLPDGMPLYNGQDESNLMGFFSSVSCYSYPHSTLLSLASGRKLSMGTVRSGKIVNVRLVVSWSPQQQGAVIQTGKQGQEGWRIWASFISTRNTPYSSVLTTNTFDKSILLQLTLDQWDSGRTPWRVAALQSGELFRWNATGLVFKFASVGGGGQRALLRVCRETSTKRCGLRPDTVTSIRAAQASAVRLALPGMDPKGTWCLSACTRASCALPKGPFPAGLANAYFTSPCPRGNTSLWYSVSKASGLAKWVNVATGKCLSLQNYTLSYDGTDWYALKYRLMLEDCSAPVPPDFRGDGQLFLTEPQPQLGEGIATLTSAMRYPNCPLCPVDWRVCAQACNPASHVGQPQCWQDLPQATASVANVVAVAGYCWAAMDGWDGVEQLFKLS